MIHRHAGFVQGGGHGGVLINALAGTPFYTPRINRTISGSIRPIMCAAQWQEIHSALDAGQEPPVWHDYLTSANQRMASGDSIAAILDLAVAAEARIRRFLNDNPPEKLKNRKALRGLKMSGIIKSWRSYGFPSFPALGHIEKLFNVRNGIMHSGIHKNADAPFFEVAAGAVTQLLSIL